jgi:hypothetical protein
VEEPDANLSINSERSRRENRQEWYGT